MGQKVNPHGLRVGVIKDWDSKWYAEGDFSDFLVEDYNIRNFLKKKLYNAGIAKIEIESFANKMFRAGSNLSSKTPEEIFYQDYKKFIVDNLVFGVGQISFMSEEELQTVKDRLMPYMEKECGNNGVKMVFFMLTNIIKESTELLCYGEGSDGLVYEAFGEKVEDSSCRLEGVVSRKKQLIPALMEAAQAGQNDYN